MKLGVSTWLWQSKLSTDGLEKMASNIADMGFEVIEVPIDEPDQMDYERSAKIIQDHGLEPTVCAAMGPGRDLIHPDETVCVNGKEYVKACIDAAHTLGATNVIGPLYSAVGRCWNSTDEERAADVDQLVKQLRELSAYASDRGVVLCLETLNRFETSFMNLTSQAIEVVDRVDDPACQIILDLFHLGIEEKNIADAIRLADHRLKHLHVSENDRGTPGTGQFAWPEIAQALHEVEYDGPVIIETFSEQNETIARAASIWRPLAESPDALAHDGLQFLKQLLD